MHFFFNVHMFFLTSMENLIQMILLAIDWSFIHPDWFCTCVCMCERERESKRGRLPLQYGIIHIVMSSLCLFLQTC